MRERQLALHGPPATAVPTTVIEVILRIDTVVCVPGVNVFPLAVEDRLVIGTVDGILPPPSRARVHVRIKQELGIISRVPDPKPIRISHLGRQIHGSSRIRNPPELADGCDGGKDARMASYLDLRSGPPQ